MHGRRGLATGVLAMMVGLAGCGGSSSGGSTSAGSTAVASSGSASASASEPAGTGPCALPPGAVQGTEQPNVVMTAMFQQLGTPTLTDTQTSATGIRQFTYCYEDANQVQVYQAVSYLIGAGYAVDPAAATPTSTSAVFSSGATNRAPRFVAFLVSGSMTVPTTAVTPSGAQLEGSGGLEISWQD